ncbi:NmrA-like family protein [Aspergillus stella-maris]|uniref:NmrA-like family protein n=1 Tax=Aspergillus stella-maris TaxID=1810926 RepID=UPI003CCDC88A
MAPTILIAGATGNTGVGVTETLSCLLQDSKAFSDHCIIALTRSSSNPTAQALAKLPNVEVIEKNWVEVTTAWLIEHQVVRAFVACYVNPLQFAEESSFLLAALRAGVQYVVRISTSAPNVRPDCPAYYPRSHWAIEALLESPEFSSMQWTSLQPNGFAPLWFHTAATFIKNFRKTGKQDGTLKLMGAEDVPSAPIDPVEIGVFAAHLLVQEDTSAHNKAKYVLTGPEDISGRQIVELVEGYIGTKVEKVTFKDMSLVDEMLEVSGAYRPFVDSIRYALQVAWDGLTMASTTSKEVLEIAAPKRTPGEVLRDLLGEGQ